MELVDYQKHFEYVQNKTTNFFDNKINEITKKQFRVIHDMQQQTRIVQSTVHDVDKEMVKIQQSETTIISNINKLQNKENRVNKKINEMDGICEKRIGLIVQNMSRKT